jgi:hypothetical protein
VESDISDDKPNDNTVHMMMAIFVVNWFVSWLVIWRCHMGCHLGCHLGGYRAFSSQMTPSPVYLLIY